MEAHHCLATRHFPAMHHHKTVLVHSSVRLPALQAKVGPPPGAARVAVVGAGVVLSCAFGTMYWKRARALQLPMHCRSPTSNGENGGAGDVLIEDLHVLLSEICIGKIDPKPPQLTKLILECLAQKDAKNVSENQDLTSLLEENFPKTNIGKHDYDLGIVLILALISEKKYAKAKEICNKLKNPMPSDSEARLDPLIAIPKDARPDLLLAIINMMMAMESMLQLFPDFSTLDLKKQLEQVKKAWENSGAGDDQESGIVSIEELHGLLSEICIRKLDQKPPLLTERIHQCLAQKGLNPDLMTSLLEGNFLKTIGQDEYNLGIILILALISEKKYVKAKEILKQVPSQSDSDRGPDLLLAIINMMMAMEIMLQFPDNKISTLDLKKQLEQVEKAWENGGAGIHQRLARKAIINMMMAMEIMLQFEKNLKEVEKAWENYKRNGNADFAKERPFTEGNGNADFAKGRPFTDDE